MSRHLSLRALAFAQATLLLAMLLAPALAAAATIQTDLFVYQDGDTVNVTGVEYGASEVVDFVTSDPDGTVVDTGSATSDDLGNVAYSFTLHVTLPGLYTVVGTGETTGLSASVQFDPPSDPSNLGFVDSRSLATPQIVLSWSGGNVPTVAANCWIIYRKTSSVSTNASNSTCSGALFGDAIARVAANNAPTYADLSVAPGTDYYYIVTAVRTNGTGGQNGQSGPTNQVTTKEISIASLPTFGAVEIGSSSSPVSVNVTNNGLGTTKISGVSTVGGNAGDFVVAGVPTGGAASVTAGSSWSFNVTFTPSGTGSRTTTLEIHESVTGQSGTTDNVRRIPLAATGNPDITAPIGSVAINNGAAVTNSTNLALRLQATDGVGVVAYRVAEGTNCAGAGYVSSGPSTTSLDIVQALTVTAGDGTKTVCAQFKDSAGNESATVTDTIILDSTLPVGTVDINNGSPATNSTTVNVHLQASDAVGVTAYRVANGANCSSAVYASVSSTTSLDINPAFTLSAGDGTKTVCAQFKDAAGNESDTVTDTILLDSTSPTESVAINNGNASTTSTSVNLHLQASDAVGVTAYRVANGANCSSAVYASVSSTTSLDINPAFTLSAGDGTKTVCAQFKDAAGNESGTVTDTILLDTAPPTPPSVTSTLPGSPANNNAPSVRGTGEAGTTVQIYTLSDCSGASAGSDIANGGGSYSAVVAVLDNTTTNFWAQATDPAGNVSACSTTSVTYVEDSVAPTVTINQAGGQSDPTNVSPINFTVTFSEPVTGFTTADVTLGGTAGATNKVATGGPTVYNVAVSGMTTNGTVTATVVANAATDLAGNNSSASTSTDNSVTFASDTTAPVITKVVTGTAGGSGWYRSNVTVAWTVTDPDSAVVIDSGCGTQNFTTETSGTLSTCSAHSAGGSASDSFNVKIDKTAPTVSATASRSADSAGWYNAAFSVHYSATDGLSGAGSCDPDSNYSGPDTASSSLSGSCSDIAGNTASASYAFKYDATAPVISNLGPTTTPNGAGWYKADVTNGFHAADALSGLAASCLANFPAAANNESKTTSGEGLAVHVASDSCADVAGNTAAAIDSANFKIDKTAPTVSATASRSADSAGWYNAAFSVHYSATDGLSGAGSCDPDSNYSGPDTASSSLSGSCSDIAGNTASASYAFKYDATAPVISNLGPTTTPNGAGWYKADVTNGFHAADALSGLAASCLANFPAAANNESKTTSGEGLAVHVASDSCADVAGNTAAAIDSANFKIDKTAPVIAFVSRAPVANGYDWANAGVLVTWSCTDPLSGPVNATVTDLLSSEGADQTASATCYDNAANSAGASLAHVNIDLTNPTIAFDHQSPAANGNGWNNSGVTLYWNCGDALSGVVMGSVSSAVTGEGQDQSATGTCLDKADNSVSDTQSGINIDLTAPVISFQSRTLANSNGWNNTDVTVTWSCSDALSGAVDSTVSVTLSAEGADQSATATCVDKAGNEASNTRTGINIDKSAPVISNTGPTTFANSNGWYNHDVVNGYSVDAGISGPDSACAAAFPGNHQTKTTSGEGTALTVTSNGCTDLAGNTASGVTSAAFKVDKTKPVISGSASPAANSNGWNNTNVTVGFTCSDPNGAAPSGIDTNSVAGATLTGEGANQHVTNTGSCVDKASNAADQATVSGINIDLTAPVITDAGPATPANGNGWYNHDVTESYSLDAGISGPDAACAAAFPGNAQTKTTTGEGYAVVAVSDGCTDLAGNHASGVPSTGYQIDKSAPVISNTGPTTFANNNGWYNHDVVNGYSVDAGISGPDSACAAAFPGNHQTKTTSGEGTALTVTSNGCTDLAGNTASGVTSAAFKVDKTNPTVAIGSPTSGSSTIASQITVSGTDGDTLSGVYTVSVNSSAATLGSGTYSAPFIPLACGSNTITALATDLAGNTQTASITVTKLCYAIQFFQPIDQSTSSPIVNAGKYGRVIPVKVAITLNGVAQSDASLAAFGLTLQMGVNGATCSNGIASDTVEAYADAGQSSGGTSLFRWDGTQWTYNLDTGKTPGVAMTVNNCYRLDAYVSDGTARVLVSSGPTSPGTPYALFKPTK
jgi:Glucodextranase, domain B